MKNTIRNIGILFLIIQTVALIYAYFAGPDVWTMKYDFSGNVISSAPKNFFIGFYVVLLVLVYGTIFGVKFWITKMADLSKINLPHKEYWSRPENIKAGMAVAQSVLDLVMCFVGVICTLALWLCWGPKSPTVANAALLGIFFLTGIFLVTVYKIAKPKYVK